MYSPKIREDLIPAIYCISQEQKRPMTQIVNGWIEERLALELDVKDELNEEWQKANENYVGGN